MKKIFLVSAFMLIGVFAYANSLNEETITNDNVKIESHYQINNNLQSASTFFKFGTCYFHMDIYNSDDELVQSYDLSWESMSADHCKSESNTLARFLIAPYL